MKRPRRLYGEVSVDRLAMGQWQVRLDQKPAATPAGNPLHLPIGTLAEAIAEEWRSQSDEVRPETMGLTRLANTAIDRIAPDRQNAVAEILKFVGSDLLCFRASGPDLLVARQSAIWDPLLNWAGERYDINLKTVCGISPIQQSAEDLARLESFLLQFNDFALAGIVAAANILGSAVLALALQEKQIDATEAFAAAELDAIYQAEIWGADPELADRNRRKSKDLELTSKFIVLATVV
jgi:chaperone required for assembly of F1-ATPase